MIGRGHLARLVSSLPSYTVRLLARGKRLNRCHMSTAPILRIGESLWFRLVRVCGSLVFTRSQRFKDRHVPHEVFPLFRVFSY